MVEIIIVILVGVIVIASIVKFRKRDYEEWMRCERLKNELNRTIDRIRNSKL